jgi:hypothetical protein
LNGGVRMMDPSETLGKPYCLEVEEGRDLSTVSPDLLDEARRHVRFAKIMEIEKYLRRGVYLKSVSLLSKMLQFAKELEVMLDYNLMIEAKLCLRKLQLANLLRDLYFAAINIPKSQILQELSNLADELMVDPNLPSLKQIRTILKKSEIEQEVFRCKSALLRSDLSGFVHSMKFLSKIDFNQGSVALKSLFISLFLQFLGIRLVDFICLGYSQTVFLKHFKNALNVCQSYFVELESMDLIRNVIKLVSRFSLDLGHPLDQRASRGMGSSSDLQTILEDLYLYPKCQHQISISKYPLLRLSSSQRETKLFPAFGRSKATADEIMNFSNRPIEKSLLNYETNSLDSTICAECFLILQVIMEDLPLTSLKKWKHSKVLQTAPTSDSIIFDLLHLAVRRYQLIQDELYFQVCKQLNRNHRFVSVLRGLKLLSVFLHTFTPSSMALPYLKNFILEMKTIFSVKDDFIHSSSHFPFDQSGSFCRNLCDYCILLFSKIEDTLPLGTPSSAVENSFMLTYDSEHSSTLLKFVFQNKPMWYNVVLMTGEVLHLSLHYSQLTMQFLLQSVLETVFPPDLRQILKSKRELELNELDLGKNIELFNEFEVNLGKNNLQNRSKAPEEASQVVDVLRDSLLSFEGFGFFYLDQSEPVSYIDFISLPIQPFTSQMVPWNCDLQWNLLEHSVKIYVGKGTLDNDSYSAKNTVVLRRKLLDSKELFSESDYEIFGAEISANDQVQRSNAWLRWLLASDEPKDLLLPSDFLRVDLLFSEDSRYVNSRLAPMSDSSFHYLLSLQLALLWFPEFDSDDQDNEKTKEVNEAVKSSSSIKSSYLGALSNILLTFRRETFSQEIAADQAIVDQPTDRASESSEGTEFLAAIDEPLMNFEKPSSCESVSSANSIDDEEDVIWKPIPVRKGEPFTQKDEEYLLKLLGDLGVSFPDHEIVNVLPHLWNLIGEFHCLIVKHDISVTSPRYRYFMKRAYHHYLVSVSSLMYENFFFDATLSKMVLEDSVADSYSEFQEKYINNFATIEVLIGLNMHGIYLLSPMDWTIIFYSPYWDITEYEFTEGKKSKKSRLLRLNFNGLKLELTGTKMFEVLEMVSYYCQEVLRRGVFPFGTTRSFEELLSLNPFTDQLINPNKPVSDTSQPSNHTFQSYLWSYSLLPIPPVVDSKPFTKNDLFFVPPTSQREIRASARFEEEKLEEEITKLAEEILLEKNQQQITKGRNELMSSSERVHEEEDENDEENQTTALHEQNGTSTHNVKLKRKNRSMFQGGRLKSNEEIFKLKWKDRLSSNICGVSNRESVFLQKFSIPSLPMKTKGKVNLATTVIVERDEGIAFPRKKESRLKPAIKSKNFDFMRLHENIPYSSSPEKVVNIGSSKRQSVALSYSQSDTLHAGLHNIWNIQNKEFQVFEKYDIAAAPQQTIKEGSYYGLHSAINETIFKTLSMFASNPEAHLENLDLQQESDLI